MKTIIRYNDIYNRNEFKYTNVCYTNKKQFENVSKNELSILRALKLHSLAAYKGHKNSSYNNLINTNNDYDNKNIYKETFFNEKTTNKTLYSNLFNFKEDISLPDKIQPTRKTSSFVSSNFIRNKIQGSYLFKYNDNMDKIIFSDKHELRFKDRLNLVNSDYPCRNFTVNNNKRNYVKSCNNIIKDSNCMWNSNVHSSYNLNLNIIDNNNLNNNEYTGLKYILHSDNNNNKINTTSENDYKIGVFVENGSDITKSKFSDLFSCCKEESKENSSIYTKYKKSNLIIKSKDNIVQEGCIFNKSNRSLEIKVKNSKSIEYIKEEIKSREKSDNLNNDIDNKIKKIKKNIKKTIKRNNYKNSKISPLLVVIPRQFNNLNLTVLDDNCNSNNSFMNNHKSGDICNKSINKKLNKSCIVNRNNNLKCLNNKVTNIEENSIYKHNNVLLKENNINNNNTNNSFTKKMSVNDFEIKEVIGTGSYSNVYLSVNKDSNKTYALKVVDKEFISRQKKVNEFLKERQILSYLNHQNIIKLESSFQNKHKLYFVLEYAEYGDLFNYLGNTTLNNINFCVNILAQLLNAVEYLHKRNIAHRDLKLENIVINKEMQIKLVDFHSAYWDKFSLNSKDNNVKKYNELVGTPEYIAPELLGNCCNNPYGLDVWSIGIIAYRLIHTTSPFKSSNNQMIFDNIRKYSNNQFNIKYKKVK